MTSNELARPRFRDRAQAGHEMAGELGRFLAGQDPIILAIPRGGVPVAAAIASELGAQIDLIIPRRIEAPSDPEVTLGAVTPDRTLVINRTLLSEMNISDRELEELSIPVWAEVQRIQQLYRSGKPYPDIKGRTAVIVDDRLITGYTVMAAIVSARKLEPARVVVAVPISYIEGLERVRALADETLSLEVATSPLGITSRFYAQYPPLTDRDVIYTLEHFWAARPPTGFSETF